MLAQTVARVGLSIFPRHACCLHVEIFSRWDTKTLAFCLGFYRLPHLARASCSECKFHTSGFYTCTDWWHSMCALVTVLPQFNTHMKVGCLAFPMDVCCIAHASIQEMPDKNGKSARDFWLPLRTKRGKNSACSSVPPCSLPRCSWWWLPSPTACNTGFGLRSIYILNLCLVLLCGKQFRFWTGLDKFVVLNICRTSNPALF